MFSKHANEEKNDSHPKRRGRRLPLYLVLRGGKIELIIGPMFSGKTTELIRRLNVYADSGFGVKILYINHIWDTRSAGPFSTHGQLAGLSEPIDTMKLTHLKDFPGAKDYDIIGIDEGQFFDDLESFTLEMAGMDKIVIISSLDSDCQRRKFGQVIDLTWHAHKVDKLLSYCTCCASRGVVSHAIYTKKIVVEPDSGSIVSVGGKDKYIAVCRPCYENKFPTFDEKEEAEINSSEIKQPKKSSEALSGDGVVVQSGEGLHSKKETITFIVGDHGATVNSVPRYLLPNFGYEDVIYYHT